MRKWGALAVLFSLGTNSLRAEDAWAGSGTGEHQDESITLRKTTFARVHLMSRRDVAVPCHVECPPRDESTRRHGSGSSGQMALIDMLRLDRCSGHPLECRRTRLAATWRVSRRSRRKKSPSGAFLRSSISAPKSIDQGRQAGIGGK